VHLIEQKLVDAVTEHCPNAVSVRVKGAAKVNQQELDVFYGHKIISKPETINIKEMGKDQCRNCFE